jgi:hypothetical protein
MKMRLTTLLNPLREFFSLEQATRATHALTELQRERVRAYHAAAMRRLVIAKDLRGLSYAPISLSLSRDAAFLAAIAFMASRDESLNVDSLTPESILSKLDETLANDSNSPPLEIEGLRPILTSSRQWLYLDQLSGPELSRRAEEQESLTLWLTDSIETRSPRELRAARVLRLAAAVGFGLALFAAVVVRILAPANLALHKPVTGTAAAFDTTVDGAVDGDKFTRFGYHSVDDESPYLTIDLGKVYFITRVKGYGRGDCCFDQSVPLALELSEDGTRFDKLAERIQPFSQSDPWIVKPGGVKARFVRLRTLRRSYLVLSEVEVNGKLPKAN